MIYYLSIIIPFYNSRKFIDKSIKNSLEISKKNPNTEIIYINNNSNDGSGIILKNKIKNIKNIKFFVTNKKDGMGPGVARNLGVKKANSDLIMFLNLIIVLYNYIPLQICLIQINQSKNDALQDALHSSCSKQFHSLH